MKSLRISEENHSELVTILGDLTVRDGKSKTFDEVIGELVRFWKDKPS